MNTDMKRNVILTVLLLCSAGVSGQVSLAYKAGVTSEQNLRAVVTLSPYSGAVGFDDRYQGVKGSPRLFDTLVASSLLVRGENEYIRMESDLDVVNNSIVFKSFNTSELMAIKSEHVAELIFHKDGNNLVFRTTEDVRFDKEVDGNKFYQVLKDGSYQFISIPVKNFKEADYQRIYSPDIRYDEFKPDNRYYILGSDSLFYRVQLTRKSLTKMFPDKKGLIESSFNEKTAVDPEAAVISLLNKF